ncbi:MAG: PAS domain-containing sensor histidine kinase [Legionella sp.]
MSEKEFINQAIPVANYPSLSEQNLAIVSSLIQAIPGFIYWKNKEGQYLGCNKGMLRNAGIPSIVGKNDFEMPWHETAQMLRDNDLEVMRRNTTLEMEEEVTIAGGYLLKGLSRKAPLLDEQGTIIGTIGVSLDITERKALEELQKAKDKAELELELMKQAHLEEQKHRAELERLLLENTKHKTQLEAQEHFTKMAQQVVHDIRSPLASILMIVKACDAIPERERIALRAASTRMSDIANNLLAQYKQEQATLVQTVEVRKPELLSATLLELLTEKKFQYQDYPIHFDYHCEPGAQFAFITIEPSQFKRMISNLINNAVEALANQAGTVSLKIDANSQSVMVRVLDNGIGMSPELTEKIINNMAFTQGKVDGHGVGLTQVRETLLRNEATMAIESTLGQGTEIILHFPRVKAPLWIAEELNINAQKRIVILDDDHSIHGAWDSRFSQLTTNRSDIKIHHFELGQQALDFLTALSPEDKKNTLLLTDFELLGQQLNGLDVIEQAMVSQAVLVTSHFENPEIQQRAQMLATRILPKQLASEVSLSSNTNNTNHAPPESPVHAIIVDDDNVFIDHVLYYFFNEHDVIAHFNSPEQLKLNLAKHPEKYPKHTKICLDHHFNSSRIKGLDFAKELHEHGYSQLYLISGEFFAQEQIPSYITVLAKENIAAIKDW